MNYVSLPFGMSEKQNDSVEDYMAERISKEAFWELVKFKYPTHQIVFCTEKALQTIKFEGSYSL